MSLDELNGQICNCRKCRLWEGARNAVPGEGPADARVMLVGQNPGTEEDKVGRPFVGRSGRFLTKTLAENGIRREELFVTNIVKHVTPLNRKPFVDEIQACVPYLEAQIRLIKPEVVVLVGAAARETPRISGIAYVEVVHPAAALRFTRMRERFRSQIAGLTKLL